MEFLTDIFIKFAGLDLNLAFQLLKPVGKLSFHFLINHLINLIQDIQKQTLERAITTVYRG